MNSKFWTLMILASLLLNGFSMASVVRLNRELSQQQQQLQFATQSMESRIHSLRGDIEQQIEAKASLIEKYDLTYGAFDPESMTVPLRLEVWPKRIEAGVSAILRINGQQAAMMEAGSLAFAGELPVSIFEPLEVSVVLDSGNMIEIQRIQGLEPLKYTYLTNFYSQYRGQIQHTPSKNEWRLQGEVWINLEPGRYAKEVRRITLAELIDGEPVKIHEIQLNQDVVFPVAKTVTLEEGQTFELEVVLEDHYGLIHREYVEGIFMNQSEDQRFNPTWQSRKYRIFNPQGELLFEAEK